MRKGVKAVRRKENCPPAQLFDILVGVDFYPTEKADNNFTSHFFSVGLQIPFSIFIFKKGNKTTKQTGAEQCQAQNSSLPYLAKLLNNHSKGM